MTERANVAMRPLPNVRLWALNSTSSALWIGTFSCYRSHFCAELAGSLGTSLSQCCSTAVDQKAIAMLVLAVIVLIGLGIVKLVWAAHLKAKASSTSLALEHLDVAGG